MMWIVSLLLLDAVEAGNLRDVEQCRALFVSTNYALARATRQYFQGEAPPGAVALAVTNYALANLLWLKDPAIAPKACRAND